MQIDRNVTQVRFETVNSAVYACEESNHALWVTCAYIYTLLYACAYKRSTLLVLILVLVLPYSTVLFCMRALLLIILFSA